MVTVARGVIGDAVVRALVERDEVRVTVRRPETAEALRAIGAKVAVRPVERPEDLAEILTRVHTVVHLIGGPNQVDDDAVLAANHVSTLAALAASRDAGVRRCSLFSVPPGQPDADPPFFQVIGLSVADEVTHGLAL